MTRKRSLTTETEGLDVPSGPKRLKARSKSPFKQIQSDPIVPSRICPPPTGHDLDRINYHIDLQDFVNDLQKAVNAIFPIEQESRYSKVDVILLSWEDEDPKLPVLLEIRELSEIFS